MATTRKEIQDLADLEDDWDGLGAMAPDADIIQLTLKLMSFLRDAIPFTRAVPTPMGGILIEWQLSSGEYLEAEVSTGDKIEWMIQEKENEYVHLTWTSHSSGWRRIPLLYPGLGLSLGDKE
jgi:hypothetical protein